MQSNLARMSEKNLLEPIKDVAVAKLDLNRDKILSCMNVIRKSFGLAAMNEGTVIFRKKDFFDISKPENTTG